MSGDARQSEVERRGLAQAAAGDPVAIVGPVRPREIRQMLSVRMEPDQIRELRAIALEEGKKVSELLREAATAIIAEHRSRQWQVRVDFRPSVPIEANVLSFDYWVEASGRGPNPSPSGNPGPWRAA